MADAGKAHAKSAAKAGGKKEKKSKGDKDN